jgi:phosphoglycerate dehydrogenase-like enzyme
VAHVYINTRVSDETRALLERELTGHAVSWGRPTDTLEVGNEDPALLDAEIVFGQPQPASLLRATRLRWVQLSSAGWARYDRAELCDELRLRDVALSTSSQVFAVPVAEHVLAMILGLNRCLPDALDEQRGKQQWLYTELRARSRVLGGERVLLLGYGGIARALVARLRPFGVELVGFRRRIRGDEDIPMADNATLAEVWREADHLVNLLPEGPETRHFVGATRLAQAKRGARLYNVGRGPTVDPDALVTALRDGTLDAAYLDVTSPEPLPPGHPLWTTPRAFVTPHSAGGHTDESGSLARHFLANLRRWERSEPLVDRVV